MGQGPFSLLVFEEQTRRVVSFSSSATLFPSLSTATSPSRPSISSSSSSPSISIIDSSPSRQQLSRSSMLSSSLLHRFFIAKEALNVLHKYHDESLRDQANRGLQKFQRTIDAWQSHEYDGTYQQTDPVAVLRCEKEILLQAFNCESHKYDWWRNLERKVPDISKAGFTSAWLPPATDSFAPEGYLPQNLYSLNSKYSSEHLLKALLQKMKQYKVRAMADIVINHRIGTTQGHEGRYNRYDGVPLSWDKVP